MKSDTHFPIAEQHQSVWEREKNGYVLIFEQNGQSIEGNAFKMCVYVTIKFIYNLFWEWKK